VNTPRQKKVWCKYQIPSYTLTLYSKGEIKKVAAVWDNQHQEEEGVRHLSRIKLHTDKQPRKATTIIKK